MATEKRNGIEGYEQERTSDHAYHWCIPNGYRGRSGYRHDYRFRMKQKGLIALFLLLVV